MKSLTRFITTKLKLKVNEQKSAGEQRADGRGAGPLFTGLDRLFRYL
jgi:hypothetical protein